MSRLQAGGLALIISGGNDINAGKCVKLISRQDHLSFTDEASGFIIDLSDLWEVEGENLVTTSGAIKNRAFCFSRRLMPLGDQQTQDELSKEKELDPSF